MDHNKGIQLYSIWKTNKTGMRCTILGFTKIPELKAYGVIVASPKISSISVEAFLNNYKKDD